MSDQAYLGLPVSCVQTTRYSTYEAHIFHAQIAEGIDRELGNLPDVHRRNGLGAALRLGRSGGGLSSLCHCLFQSVLRVTVDGI